MSVSSPKHKRSLSGIPSKKTLRLTSSFSRIDKKQWAHDRSYNTCFGCLRAFSMFVRRHHCRVCGHLFCSSCSSSRLQISEQTFIRVCDGCQQQSPIPLAQETNTRDQRPQSIFALSDRQVACSLSLGENSPSFSKTLLSPTLSCRCWNDPSSPAAAAVAVAVSTATFDLTTPSPTRVRIDLQLSGPFTAEQLCCVRVQQKRDIFLGVTLVRTAHCRTFRLVEELYVECVKQQSSSEGQVTAECNDCDDASEEKLVVSGSFAWRMDNEFQNHANVDGSSSGKCDTFSERRRDIRQRVEMEKQHCMLELIQVSREEDANRNMLDESCTELDSALSRHNSPQEHVERLRRRSSVHWEAVQTLVGKRTKLNGMLRHLCQMSSCLDQSEQMPISIPLTMPCMKCMGSLSC